ncbi:formylglycine-generating enzyme family protein [Streptomyces europaeiscabiei]|uniref:formylglycine-generating enzyme family protein n=1 Tax=Streptomyces europaeiscabiei TaxID=146819 RepID=UPI002E11BB26|nr:formylglycine-generating enzyme family protein [Streptomyces europaeiscabiei]
MSKINQLTSARYCDPDSPQLLSQFHLPDRLRSLGFSMRVSGSAITVIPPTVPIPRGSFIIGSDASKDRFAYGDECPQHLSSTAEFEIGRFPVTVAEYWAAVREGAVPEPAVFRGVTWRQQQSKPALPVTSISWFHAVTYAAWLAERLERPCRLPTEAEWEKAARGTEGWIYPWGDTWDPERANTPDGGLGEAAEIGFHPGGVSPYGVHDMVGNVWEWCSSILLPYPYEATDGREELYVIRDRVMRGGAWYCVPYNSRVACRGFGHSAMYLGGGFRLVFPAA